MSEFTSLLPSSSTSKYEATHEQVAFERIELPIEIRELYRPGEIPEDILPWLAWAKSTDLWVDSWSTEKKRHIASQWFNLHRYKGTLHGIERHIHYIGAELKRVIVPPAKTFLTPSLTRDEREAFLARFQQLRIYPYVQREQAKYGAVAGKGTGGLGFAKTFLGGGPDDLNVTSTLWTTDWITFGRYRRTAKLYEPRDDSLTDLTYRTVQAVNAGGVAVECEEVVLPGRASGQTFPNTGAKARLFFGLPSTKDRVVCVNVERYYQHTVGKVQYHAISPSLDPIDVRPQHRAERGSKAKGSIFPCLRGTGSQQLHGTYLPPSTAWERMYDVLWLHDKTRLPDERPRFTHLGHTRLGMPAYHAHLTVAIRKRRTKKAVAGFAGGLLIPPDPQPVDDTRLAIKRSKAKRDKILMQTQTLRPVQFGDRIKFGDGVKFGELTKDF